MEFTFDKRLNARVVLSDPDTGEDLFISEDTPLEKDDTLIFRFPRFFTNTDEGAHR